jgi:probable rRNA maturation factor
VVILQKRIAGLKQASLERFVLLARRAARVRGIVDVLVTGNDRMRALNRQFRGKNIPTDVLSFPVRPSDAKRGRTIRAGEIAISAKIAADNAARFGHSAAEEVRILTLHGLLHLAGFDHERDNGQMARKEMKLRQALGLHVALIERSDQVRRETANRTSRRHSEASRKHL